MRTLGRLLLGIVVLGLVAGWLLRSRVPRRHLPLVLAGALLPAVVHGVGSAWWAASFGADLLWLALYGLAVVASLVLAWWWMRRNAAPRPFSTPFALPAQALVQVLATSLLDRAAGETGAINVLPAVALTGASVAIAAALIVMLPTREHFPRFGLPSAPRWWVALTRSLRGRR